MENQSMKRQYYKTLYEALVKAQEQRSQRGDWMEFELKTMFDGVNEIRVQRGQPLVSLGDIKRVETGALGHVDYTSKFALYCAELAVK